jgi:pantoate--beta-alanine ligase
MRVSRLHARQVSVNTPPMLIARTSEDLATACASLRASHGTLALVPTMGALHDGHLALLGAARMACAATAVSIFVNPTQFGASEDLARYPRDEDGDLDKLRRAGCDLVWLPDAAAIYPPGDATVIDPAGPALGWEGEARPGHFRGVATVVAKLFGHVRPDAAIFGEKDWQQLQVIRRMVADLVLPVRIVGAPILRDPDGLAMSSRNRFLSAGQRDIAPELHRELTAAAAAIARGAAPDGALRQARDALSGRTMRVDYLALVDGETLLPIDVTQDGARMIAAALLGSVRLLDNVGVT